VRLSTHFLVLHRESMYKAILAAGVPEGMTAVRLDAFPKSGEIPLGVSMSVDKLHGPPTRLHVIAAAGSDIGQRSRCEGRPFASAAAACGQQSCGRHDSSVALDTICHAAIMVPTGLGEHSAPEQ
jgi:hypothetical protein